MPPRRSTPASLNAPLNARRRGRPPVITDDRLLEAARDVFLARGIRATTAEVAERAQISEGTIFHRYKTKDALFRAAMQFDPDDVPRIIDELTPRAGEGDLRETLIALALRILSFGRVGLPMMMMAWSNPGSDFSLEKMLVNKQLAHERPFRALKTFFDAEIERGRLGPVNSQVLTRMFVGTLRDFCVSELLANTEAPTPPRELAENVVDLILRAARPSEERIPSVVAAPAPSRARVRARRS
jgi:AcrR family transcriptional regulator